METNDVQPRPTRRDLIVGATGAAAALAAEVIMKPAPAAAATGDPVFLGNANEADATTSITLTGAGSGVSALEVTSTNDAAALVARGQGGVSGSSNTTFGIGVSGSAFGSAEARGVGGFTDSGTGVQGSSTSGIGVLGHSQQSAGIGVRAENSRGVALDAESDDSYAVHALSNNYNALYARSARSDGIGVYGVCPGIGVYGDSPLGYGVWGQTEATDPSTSAGVHGESDAGVGVSAKSTSGRALDVNGKVHFSRSGLTPVPTNANPMTVPGVSLSATSAVLVTLQIPNAGNGAFFVIGVQTDPATSSFKVRFNQKINTAGVKLAWMVLD